MRLLPSLAKKSDFGRSPSPSPRANMLAASCRTRAAATILSPASVITLPSFLVPALVAPAAQGRRQFSASAAQPSKLGRTPISIPPGVELTIGEPWVKQDLTTYKQTPKRTLTITGPLGRKAMPIAHMYHASCRTVGANSIPAIVQANST